MFDQVAGHGELEDALRVGQSLPRCRRSADPLARPLAAVVLDVVDKILTAFPWDTRDGLQPRDRGRWPIAPLLWLLILLGLRRGELAAATYDNVDLERRRLLIPTSKSGDPILVPLPSLAVPDCACMCRTSRCRAVRHGAKRRT